MKIIAIAQAFRKEITKLHLLAALLTVMAAAGALATTANLSPTITTATIAAAWLSYSAAVAKATSKNFLGALQKSLFLDSLTYLPLLLPWAIKAAMKMNAVGFGIAPEFADLPTELALGLAIAANIAGKAILFPKNIDAKFGMAKKIKFAVAASVAAYFLFFSVVSIMKHNSFNSTAFDLAIFDQTMWAYSQGYGLDFFNTARGLVLLGDHMHPMLFAYAQLYRLSPMPETLLALQSLALALGALPIYWLAKKKLGELAAASISTSYLLYPSLHYVNLFDFHPEAFLTPLLLFAFYFADAKKYAYSILALIPVALTKEHMPLAFLSMGAYIAIWQKKRMLGLALAAAGLIWTAINFKILLPHFAGGGYGYAQWYSYLGKSLSEIAKNALTHPQLVISNLFDADKIAYAALLLFPLGALIALLGLPFLLLGAPFFAIQLLRGDSVSSFIAYHHTAELIPFIYLAAIAGIPKLLELLAKLKLNNTKTAVAIFLLLTTIAASTAYGPFSTIYDLSDFSQSEHTKTGHKLISEIPADASVSADPYTLPHLSHRKQAYMFPNPFIHLMYGKSGQQEQAAAGSADYVILDLDRASPTYDAGKYAEFISEFMNNEEYGLAKLEGGYALFRKGESYTTGLCELNKHFTTPTAAIPVNLSEVLKEENKIYLKGC